jgi:hypothetical protein
MGGGAAFLIDVVVDAADLVGRVAELGGDLLRRAAMFLGPEDEAEPRMTLSSRS